MAKKMMALLKRPSRCSNRDREIGGGGITRKTEPVGLPKTIMTSTPAPRKVPVR